MNTYRCHACNHLGPVDVKTCEVCGTAVRAAVPPAQAVRGFDRPRSSGAIWLDDLPPAEAQVDPALIADTVPAALPELAITLLEFEGAAPAHLPSPAAPVLPLGEALFWPSHESLLRPASAPAGTPVAAPPAQPNTARAKRKAERRAAVRKSRLRGKPAAGSASAVSQVLVFGALSGDRDRLCNVLRAFGFRVHAVNRAEEAVALAASQTLVAAFFDLSLDAADGGSGLDLCQQVRAAGRCRGGTETLLILTATRLKPTDRVLAELAGCEEAILKPVTRGSVAGVLDSRGIVLPADRRRS